MASACGRHFLLTGLVSRPQAAVLRVWAYKHVSYTTSSPASHFDNSTGQAAKPFAEIPGPRGLPFVGTLFQFPRQPNKLVDFLQDRCNKYYPIYKECIGAMHVVVVYDLGEIEKLFRTEEKYPQRFDNKYWMDYRKIRGESDGVLTSNGEEWHRMRKAIDKPMLRLKEVATYADNVNVVVTDFLERLSSIRQQDGLVPDLERELFNWSLESIGKILYDKRFGGLSNQRDKEMQEFIDAVRSVLLTTVQLIIYPPWLSKIIFRRVYQAHNRSWDTLFRIARMCIDEKMDKIAKAKSRGEEDEGSVLSYLLSHNPLPMKEVYSNVTELMTGAVDTTSTAILWCLEELAVNPDVQNKLLQEVDTLVPEGQVPSYQDLQRLPYLKAVVKEILRLRPVSIGLNRITQEDRVLCGYHIPPGTSIVIYSSILGRLPQYFEDPHTFKPERWLRGTGEKLNPFSQIAFGFGTRMCVGRRIAELEINMLLTQLIRKFTIEPGFTERATPSPDVVIKPDRPIKIKLIERRRP